jgi:hypothetical protein
MLKRVALEIQSLFTDLRLSASTVDGPIDTFLIQDISAILLTVWGGRITSFLRKSYNELPEGD